MPAFSPEQSIPQRFEEMVRRFSQRPAILVDASSLTYDDLNRRANRIAHQVLKESPEPRTPAAILMRHDLPLFPAVLGALKAGKIVTVLNPTDPQARQLEVIRHADPSVILCDSASRVALQHATVPVINVESPTDGSDTNPGLHLAPTDLAFLLFTSGSTGAPKAVMQPHRNVLHNILRYTIGLDLTEYDRILLLASLSGGQGMATVWQALLNGGAAVPFPAMERGVIGLADCIRTHRVTLYISSASLFRHFVLALSEADRFDSIRIVRLGSESAPAEAHAALRRHFAPGARLFQTLSSSETGNVTQHAMDRQSPPAGALLPVGRPAHEMEVLLRNQQGQPARDGEPGEIVVRSNYLSPGYWKDDGLTKEKFCAIDGVRAYRMGDLGRWDNGILHYLGRVDQQVKIGGFRVELQEVEAALQRIPDVRDAIAVARAATGRGTLQIAAYVSPRSGVALRAEDVRAALRERLPRHMIPAAIVILDCLPLNPHGKVDRRALPEAPLDVPPDELDTPCEKAVAEAWSSVLKAPVGRDSDFFDLAGDSLAAAVIAARLNAEFGIALDFRFFLEHPTVSQQAAYLDGARQEDSAAPAIPHAPPEQPVPLTYTQEAIYRQCTRSHRGYLATVGYQITGPLRVELLEKCLKALLSRHAGMRAVVQLADGRPVQVVRAVDTWRLPMTDVSSDTDPDAQASAILRTEADRPMDFATGPLVRFMLVKIGPERHQLIRVAHHLVTDAWSWRLFHRELAEDYERALAGRAEPETPRLQFADFALWQQQALAREGPAYRELVEWWIRELAGCPDVRLPFARSAARARWLPYLRPWLRRKSQHWWGVPADVALQLKAVAAKLGVTGFAARLGLFAALLAECTGADDLVIGVASANRALRETHDIFGFFANRVPVRVRTDRGMTLGAHLQRVQKTVAEAQAHAALPHDLLAEEFRARGLRMPRLRAVFKVTFHQEALRFGGLEFSWHERQFEEVPGLFTLAFDEHREATHNRAQFHPFKYDARRVEGFLKRYLEVLSNAPSLTDQPLNRLFGR